MVRKEWILYAENELRCEVGETEPLYVRLLKGNAEIFGIEMAPGKEYAFVDENFAIFSWFGCTVETIGNCDIYSSDNTPMVAYVNTHIQLEARRDVALANTEDGPRVLIVGPSDHGKSTTARILAVYAARLDRTPIFVDLDVGQSSVTIPGCLSAVPLDKVSLSIEDGFTNLNPIIYYHGHNTPRENTDMYKFLVDTLATKIRARFDRDTDARASGIIVNSAGWIDGPGYEVILHCVKSLKVDVILVMSHDRLQASLLSSLGDKVTVVKLAHSGGVVQRSPEARRRHRKLKIRQYFYGRYKFPPISTKLGANLNPNTAVQNPPALNTIPTLYSPSRQSLQLSSLKFYRAGGLQLSEGMRMIGESATSQDNTQLIRFAPTADLINSIVAVLHPIEEIDTLTTTTNISMNNTSSSSSSSSSTDQQDKDKDGLKALGQCNIAGFLWLVQVEPESDSVTFISPCPGALPSKHILVGSLKFVE